MAAEHSPYKPGDPPPSGYLNWHAWAEVQDKAGLQQKQCPRCGLWMFPQEQRACSKCHDGVSVVHGQTFPPAGTDGGS